MTTPRSRSRPRESETARLQKDLESLTKTISLQQRRTASLVESLRVVASEVENKRELLQTVVPTPRDIHRLTQKASLLENQLMQERVALNRELKENRSLQDRINESRREKNRLEAYFHDMKTKSEEMEIQAKDFSARHHSFDASESEFKFKLMSLREKAVRRITDIQSSIAEAETDRMQSKLSVTNLNLNLFTDNEVFVDSITVLRQLYRKWVDRVKEQKKAVEQYNRTVRFLTESFEEIKNATGIPSIDEMVTAYIKAYEQEQDMTEGLTKLSSEADYLQDTLKALEIQHREQMMGQKGDLMRQKGELENLRGEMENLRKMFVRKVREEGELRAEMGSIFQPVESLVRKFRDCRLPPGPISTSEGMSHSESDLLQYIKELESGISFLFSYYSHGSGLPSSMYESSIANKTFTHHIRLPSTNSSIPGRKSLDDIEEPLTEAELRERAVRRVAISKLF